MKTGNIFYPWEIYKEPIEVRNEHEKYIRIRGTTQGTKFKIADIPFTYTKDFEIDKRNETEAYEIAYIVKAAPDLLEALEALMSEIDKGNLVRDISHDHESDWQIRQLPLYQSLSKAATAIKKARGI